jgi:glucosylceramidase
MRIRQFQTARDNPIPLSELSPLSTGDDLATLPSVWIDAHKYFQVLEGFGGAFTEAGAVSWQSLSTKRQQSVLEDYFCQQSGHGYTMCRVHMNSCDFSLGNYAHVQAQGDIDLRGFDISRDRQSLLPFIKAAQAVAKQVLKLLVSPWSPPAWMKSNGDMNNGGYLLPQFRRAWALCYVRFIQAYEAEGVPIWGVSVQNEPEAAQRWDSCIYTAEQERDFVRDFLGPELEAAGLSRIKIVIWDHNRDQLVRRASVVYADPEAAKYVWGAGFHWYGENHFEQVQLTHDAWPDKQLLFTESCQEGGPHNGEWAVGERYARSIINDLNRWTVGWIDWNLLLDETGGPNHVGNLCSAPILVDRPNDSLLHQSAYYYLGHFARFIKPGARRLLCSASKQDLESTAFFNPDGSVAVVVMNCTEQTICFALSVNHQSAATELPPRSIATYLMVP